MSKPIATPSDYQLIFEEHKIGNKVYEDLVSRFARTGSRGEGLDKVINTFEAIGAMKVIEYITLRINQANGVKDYAE